MRIGIDLDGCLTDEHGFIIDYGTKYFSNNNIKYCLHNDVYDSKEIFEVTEEQYNQFWKDNLFDYSKNISIRPFAANVINKLKDNNEIYIITARYLTTYENENKEKMQNIVKEWLKLNNVLYDEVIFSEDKVNVCENLKIDIMIEDKPENILLISSKIPVICYNHPYNEKLHKDNIIRCHSWYDIYAKIKNFEIIKNSIK